MIQQPAPPPTPAPEPDPETDVDDEEIDMATEQPSGGNGQTQIDPSVPDIDSEDGALPMTPTLGYQAPPPPVPPSAPVHVSSASRGSRRRRAAQQAQMSMMGSPTSTTVAPYVWDVFPEYGVKLWRIDQMTGMRSEIAAFISRPRSDLYNPMGWIPAIAGGGNFIIGIFRPGSDFTVKLHELPWSTPGEPRMPPWVQQSAQQPPNPMAQFGYPGMPQPGQPVGQPQYPWGYPSPWMNPWAMMPQQKDNSEVISLRGELGMIRTELANAKEIAREDSEKAALRQELGDLRRQITDLAKPKGDTMASITALAGALSPVVTQFLSSSQSKEAATVTMLQAQMQQVIGFMNQASASQKDEMKQAFQLILAGRDPGKIEGTVGTMVNMVTNMLGRVIQMAQMQVGQGQPWYADVIGNVFDGLKEWIPQIGIMALARKDPEAASDLAKSLSGSPEPPHRHMPPAQQRPQLPARQPVQVTQVPVQPPQAPPATPVPPAAPPGPTPVPIGVAAGTTTAEAVPVIQQVPQVTQIDSDTRKVPTGMIRKLAAWARSNMPPEELAQRFGEFVAFCYRFEAVPASWESENWWREAIGKPVNALSILWERVGEDVSMTEEYAKALDAAGSKLAQKLAQGGAPEAVDGSQVEEDDEEDGDEDGDAPDGEDAADGAVPPAPTEGESKAGTP